MSSAEPPPATYREHATLRDGRPVLIRAVRPEDKEALREGFRRLSPSSIYFRFFQPKQSLSDADLAYLTELDFVNHVGLLAVREEGGTERGIGVGRYIVQPGTGCAEVAFTVVDTHQGLGVATILLEHLMRIARSRGLRQFEAWVMPENRKMLEVLEHTGLPMKRRLEGKTLVVTLSLESERTG